MAGTPKVSLSDLYADACRRLEIIPEEALGCERFPHKLRLLITKDEWVDFELVEDGDRQRMVLGNVVES